MTTDETWLIGLRHKRPLEWLRCLSYILEAARRQGYCSANNVPEGAYFAEPNTIGACFKDLRRFGLHKTQRYEKCRAARKHGRDVPRWEVYDYVLLHTGYVMLTRVVADATRDEHKPEQMELAV